MPHSEMIETLSNFGFPAVAFGVILWLLNRQLTLHRQERDEWRKEYEAMAQRYDDRQRETNTILRELTLVIQSSQSDPD